MLFIGNKDVDRLILLKITCETDLLNACRTCKYAYSIYKDEKFWVAKLFDRFGPYLDVEEVRKYRKNISWKDYYFQILRAACSPYPYFMDAMYMDDPPDERREDILNFLEKFHKIEHVEKIELDFGDTFEEFFTRDGDIDGIREGIGHIEHIGHGGHFFWVRIYRSGYLLEETYFENGKKKFYREFHLTDANDISINIEYSSKEKVVLHERYLESGVREVQKWFANGKIRAKGILFNNKKQGIWHLYSKTGTLTRKKYHRGRLAKY